MVAAADAGVERLMNIYVSMGVTPPKSMPGASKPALPEARARRTKRTAKPPKPAT